MDQRFRRKSDGALILTVKTKQQPGDVNVDDGMIRHTVHHTLDGVQVEIPDTTPTPVAGDRQISFDVPYLVTADLETLRDLRSGDYGLPITWGNDVTTTPVDGIIVSIISKPWPGLAAHRATVVFQPL